MCMFEAKLDISAMSQASQSFCDTESPDQVGEMDFQNPSQTSSGTGAVGCEVLKIPNKGLDDPSKASCLQVTHRTQHKGIVLIKAVSKSGWLHQQHFLQGMWQREVAPAAKWAQVPPQGLWGACGAQNQEAASCKMLCLTRIRKC